MSFGGTRASRKGEGPRGITKEHVLGDGGHSGVVVALAMRVGFGGSVDW